MMGDTSLALADLGPIVPNSEIISSSLRNEARDENSSAVLGKRLRRTRSGKSKSVISDEDENKTLFKMTYYSLSKKKKAELKFDFKQ